MARVSLDQRIDEGVLVIDGGMGTQLMARGVEPGACSDWLNVESPEIVESVLRAYHEAGSGAAITNTFGANCVSLKRHGLEDKCLEINKAGAEIARKVVGADSYVLGDIGPCGDFLEPLGTLKPEQLKEAFAMQAKGLALGGADGIIIETMTSLEEIALAAKAAKSVCDLPILTSLAYDMAGDDFRTMMGVDVESAVKELSGLGIIAIGFNCGTVSLAKYIELAEKHVEAVSQHGPGLKVLAEPNAGLPEIVDGAATYSVGPEEFAQAVLKIVRTGVSIVGGCCGTGPEHIAAVAQAVKGENG